jgi:Tfp pilus assembly protein PilO
MKIINGDLKDRLVWCRRAQWALAVVLLLLGGAIWLFWIKPEHAMLDAAQAHIAMLKQQLAQDQNQIRNLPKVEQEIERLRTRVERFDEKLPKQQDLAQFINAETRISQEAALTKLCWHLDSKPRQGDHFIELPIQLSFEGDFQSGVLAFLRGTENLQRLTRVHKLQLTSDGPLSGQVKAEVTMNIYFGEE